MADARSDRRVGIAGCKWRGFSLDVLVSLNHRNQVAELLDPLYSAAKNVPAWPPLAVFSAQLLTIW